MKDPIYKTSVDSSGEGQMMGNSNKYSNLISAGKVIATYGGIIKALGIIAGIAGIILIMVAILRELGMPAFFAGGGIILTGLALFVSGLFMAAFGEAAIALADIAINTSPSEKTPARTQANRSQGESNQVVAYEKTENIGRFLVSEPVKNEITVADSTTKLIWQGNYIKGKTWEEAVTYSESLLYGGFEDWRLPTKEELESLVNKSRKNPSSDFPGMPSEWFWTSHSDDASGAWHVNFCYGNAGNYGKGFTGNVRCVRGP